MQTSPCGLGGPANPTEPCTGTYGPSQAGTGVFASLSASPVASAIVAAGLLIAGVLFAVFISRMVGRFFGKSDAETDITKHKDFKAAEKLRADYEYRQFKMADAEDDTEDDESEDESRELVIHDR